MNWFRHASLAPRPDPDEPYRSAGVGLIRSVAGLVLLSLFALVVVIPFLYMLIISFKTAPEVGNGRLLPEALSAMFTLGRNDLVWLQGSLTEEQAAAMNETEGIRVAPLGAEDPVAPLVSALPSGSVPARIVGLSRESSVSTAVLILLEAEDPAGILRSAGRVMLLHDGIVPGTWEGVEVRMAPRTTRTMLSRLLVNYRLLLDWNRLEEAGVLRWITTGYPRWFLNSLFVALSTVLLGLFFDSLAAFAFAKFDFPLRRPLFLLLLATIMIPYPVTLVPTFFLFAKMGFYNTYAALVVPGLVSAFGIFLVRQYIMTIPDDMLDAGRVDGAGDFRLYMHIIVPTARPVLAALAVFRFIWQWNSYLYPLVLTNRDNMKTVQLGLSTIQDNYGMMDHGLQMAGAALAVVPILVVYSLMQKHFISGITLGSVKG